MSFISKRPWGRRFIGGLTFLIAGLALAVSVAHAADNADPTLPPGMAEALERIAKLKAAAPLDLDALQTEYLILFENFPRHQLAKEAIFDLYHVMRRNQRTSQAYAALTQIQSVYQTSETMTLPGSPKSIVGMVATAAVEEAYIYAKAMDNPYQAIDTLRRVLSRYTETNVGTVSPDRTYFGRSEIIAALEIARFRLAADQSNLATEDLLGIVRDWSGAPIRYDGMETTAPVAAVRLLGEVLAAMPASLPKRQRVLATFEQTAIEEPARVWLAFTRADIYFAHYEKWRGQGTFTEGAQALRAVIDKHRDVEIETPEGKMPAGLLAMKRLRDAEARILGNVTQAGQTLSAYQVRFAAEKKDRLFAAYALLYLAEFELDFRGNPNAAFQLFMQVVDDYADVPLFPGEPGQTIAEHARRWAERAQQRM